MQGTANVLQGTALSTQAAAIALRPSKPKASQLPTTPQRVPPLRVLPKSCARSLRADWNHQLRAEELLVTLSSRLPCTAVTGRVPVVEEELLGKLKEATKDDCTSKRAAHGQRAELEKVLEILEAKVVLLAKLEGLITEGAINPSACSTAAVQQLAELLSEIDACADQDAHDQNVLPSLTAELLDMLVEPHEEVVFSKMAVTHETTYTFSTGITAMCTDGNKADGLFLGLDDGRLVHATVSGGVDREYPGHQYEVMYLTQGRLQGRKCIVSTSRDKTVRVVDTDQQEIIYCLTQHAGCVTSVHIVADTLVTSSLDCTVCYWQLVLGKMEGVLVKVQTNIHASVVSGRHLFLGTRDGMVHTHLLDYSAKPWVAVETEKWKAHKLAVLCMTYHNEDFLVTGGEDSQAIVWDVKHFPARPVRRLVHHVDSILSLFMSSDGLLFTAGADALLVIWDAITGSVLKECREHYNRVRGVALLTLPAVSDPPPVVDVKQTYSELRKLFAIPDNDLEPQPSSESGSHEAITSGGAAADASSKHPRSDDVSQWETAAVSIDMPTTTSPLRDESDCRSLESTRQGGVCPEADEAEDDDDDTHPQTCYLVTASLDRTLLVRGLTLRL
eukprot:Sspe_Gene.60208::Locus_33160_Transcript_2_2_Confidence_0.667_Length_1990::g.60208::m.60208